MKHRNPVSIILYMCAFSALMTIRCSAYIDPAATSYIIQIIAGICIASGTAIGIAWSRIKRLFKKKSDPEPEKSETPSDASENKIVSAEELLSGDDDD